MNTPRRWKVVFMNFAVVFPTLQFNVHVIAPWLAGLPTSVRDVLLVLLMCIVLSFAIPKANQIFETWLRR